MVKTWAADNPKAALMERKRNAIVEAARIAFLDSGYSGGSVNRIAAAAGVSIKTLYRHFESKDELFAAVMRAACASSGACADGAGPPEWYRLPPAQGLAEAGREYLRHFLADDHLALYRVVVRDAGRDPELGRIYLREATGRRNALFAGYLDLWSARCGWTAGDSAAAAETFAGVLKAGLFEAAVLGVCRPGEQEIDRRACGAAAIMEALLGGDGAVWTGMAGIADGEWNHRVDLNT